MIDIHNKLMRHRPEVRLEEQKNKSQEPRVRWMGQWVDPEHPAYKIIRNLILEKYKVKK